MPIESLLLCRDADVLRTLRRVLDEIGIHVLVSSAPDAALQLMQRRKFDALIVDCDGVPGSEEVLRQLRQGSSNRSAIVFAVVNGNTSVRAAFDLGANFVLDKPLSPERAMRSFRAAAGLMMRERRRYFRHEVDISLTVSADGTQVRGSVTNLSEGGLAIRTPYKFSAGGSVRVVFTLPNGRQIDGRGEIAWTAGERAGVRLLFLTDQMKAELTAWLNRFGENDEPAPLFINASRGMTRAAR